MECYEHICIESCILLWPTLVPTALLTPCFYYWYWQGSMQYITFLSEYTLCLFVVWKDIGLRSTFWFHSKYYDNITNLNVSQNKLPAIGTRCTSEISFKWFFQYKIVIAIHTIAIAIHSIVAVILPQLDRPFKSHIVTNLNVYWLHWYLNEVHVMHKVQTGDFYPKLG